MMDAFLDRDGLSKVAEKVNEKLKTVETMPASPSDKDVVLYVGESASNYIKGHTYQYQTNSWVDISPAGGESSIREFIFQNSFVNKWEETKIGKPYSGRYMWTDGTDYYYSINESSSSYSRKEQYVFDEDREVFTRKTWTGPLKEFNAYDTWSDGVNVYYDYGSKHYKFNKNSKEWEENTWVIPNTYNVDGLYCWTDGTDFYSSTAGKHIKLIKGTNEWEVVTFTGLPSDAYGYGMRIIDGGVYYCSLDGTQNYKFDKSANSWSRVYWKYDGVGSNSIHSGYAWTDGTDWYLNGTYVLEKGTRNWLSKSWIGTVYGRSNNDTVWRTRKNIYCSYSESDTYYTHKLMRTLNFNI